MAQDFITSAGVPLGFQPNQLRCRAINRTGSTLVAGECVMFDLGQTDAAVTTTTVADSASIFVNVITPITAGLQHGIFGIVVEGGVDNAEIQLVLHGIVDADVQGANACAVTDVLYAENGDRDLFSDVVTGGEKIIGIPLETTAAAGAETIKIWFNGITGFGGGT